MRLSVIGTGYVGLVSGTCFAEMGNDVICVDNNDEKIENLKKGIIPIYEPGLEKLVLENYKRGTLIFTTNIKDALEKTKICFIAVGTPMGEDGSADLQYVLAVAEAIGQYMIHDMIVVDKSTVPIGTADLVKETITKKLAERKVNYKVNIISNPEFLKEGAAVSDCLKPDRVIIGSENEESLEVMKELYAPFTHNHERFIAMDVRSAEMTKYAANCMLATKISFMNEISNICEKVGADVNEVRRGIGSDSRIGYSFIYPGCGYGGSCFPKDVQALIQIAKQNNYQPKVMEAVEAINEFQKKILVEKVKQRFGDNLAGFNFAIWGLAFKPETDDMREASSVTIINELTKLGAKVKAYDPKSIETARDFYLKGNSSVTYTENKYDTLDGSDALLLITEWKEFRSPDFDEIGKRLKKKIIFDGRNQYNSRHLKKMEFEYYQIGVAAELSDKK